MFVYFNVHYSEECFSWECYLWENLGNWKIFTLQTSYNVFLQQAKDWATLMVQMSGSGPGYLHETIITPYMHALVFHVPTMIKMHGSLRQFSGQGIDSVTITSDIGYDCSKTSRNLQKTTVYNHKFVLTTLNQNSALQSIFFL